MYQLLSLLPSIPWPSVTIPAAVLLSWLSIARAYRWRRYNYIHRVYGPKYKTGTLTLEDAQEIVHIITQYEMPVIMEYALTFALFKPYAITFILINTWLQCPISGFMQGNKPLQDPRANLAIARTNFLHSKYRIKNDDYIFTLSLWIFEPERWAANYGWRSLSPLEVHAFFILWLEIARRMNIKDVPETEEALKEWVEASLDYESKYMVPDPMNHSVALLTTKELIWQVPDVLGLRNFARKLSIAMLEDRFRIAMMFVPAPSALLEP
ncbi:hypothetical protein MPER_11604 [Moniliophthora perniciosa FA553]|nr:hypothetical protein MPER_11604 [Moniliophthora perniciosa FA553]